MPERYRHPPLVELIAELRWSFGEVLPGRQIPILSGQHEEFFMRFGSKAGGLGYDLVERVVPPGFPALPFQPIFRFRKKDQPQGTTLYQIGAGVFSANITPPYHSWQHFRPVVEKGVDLVLEARTGSEKPRPFSAVSLRYIDAFGSKFTEGRSMATFLRDVMGFAVELPAPVRDEIAPQAEAKATVQVSIPLRSEQQMHLILAEGLVRSEQAVMMDTTVSSEKTIKPTAADAMAAFDAAHDVIHRVFVGTTKKLTHIMELIEGEAT